MRRTDRTKRDRKYLKANILGFSLKIHKTVTILLSIMIFITLTSLALAKVYNMKQSQNITDKAITRKITQQETSTHKKASSTQIELPEETDTQANEEEYKEEADETQDLYTKQSAENEEADSLLVQKLPHHENPVWFNECVKNGHKAFWVGSMHGHTDSAVCEDCQKNEGFTNEETLPCLMEEENMLSPKYIKKGEQVGNLYEFTGFIKCCDSEHTTRTIKNNSTGQIFICDTCKEYYTFYKQ